MDEISTDECRELYAHFGLAFYCSNVLEHGIAHALLILELMEGRAGAKNRVEQLALVDQHFEDSFEKTFGNLRQRLASHESRLPTFVSVMDDLGRCVDERNFLAHHFWREHAAHWFTKKGRATMVQRLEKARDLFSQTDRALEAAVQPLENRYGITEDLKRRELELMKQEISNI